MKSRSLLDWYRIQRPKDAVKPVQTPARHAGGRRARESHRSRFLFLWFGCLGCGGLEWT